MTTTARTLAVIAALALAAVAVAAQPLAIRSGAPTLYYNANVYTADDQRPRAAAFIVRAGRFGFVGSEAEARRVASEIARGGDYDAVDLGGRTVLPGLIDAHGHLDGLGALATGVIDLSTARRYDDVVRVVAARAAQTPPGDWIVGRGWDNESWPDNALPHHRRLSEAVPDHPVWLTRVDGHAALANDAAMRLAGITAETASPAGGEILKDDTGEPTGVFVDAAEALVARHIPADTLGEPRERFLAAQDALLEAGITTVHDMGTDPELIDLLRVLQDQDRLNLRVRAYVPGRIAETYFENVGRRVGNFVSVLGAKFYMDGAMGSRGAWLLEPYEDRPGTTASPYTGLQLMPEDELVRAARHALRHNYQLATHAIGDRANRAVLDAYAAADLPDEQNDTGRFRRRQIIVVDEPAEDAPTRLADARFRVEHAQLIHPEDVDRFAELGVIPSMQPRHATTDMRWAVARVGQTRAQGAYAWASLLRAGSTLPFGSDFPVEPVNPFLGFYAAVTRQNPDGSPTGGWFPAERLTRHEALLGFTRWAAHAAFDENRLGAIRPGAYADFIVIDRDVMIIDAADIPATRVLRTVVDGRTVYQRPDETP